MGGGTVVTSGWLGGSGCGCRMAAGVDVCWVGVCGDERSGPGAMGVQWVCMGESGGVGRLCCVDGARNCCW